jgi:hypothetical protein
MTIVNHKQALKRQTVLIAETTFPPIPMQVNENSLKTIMSGTKTRLPRQPKTVTTAKAPLQDKRSNNNKQQIKSLY